MEAIDYYCSSLSLRSNKFPNWLFLIILRISTHKKSKNISPKSSHLLKRLSGLIDVSIFKKPNDLSDSLFKSTFFRCAVICCVWTQIYSAPLLLSPSSDSPCFVSHHDDDDYIHLWTVIYVIYDNREKKLTKNTPWTKRFSDFLLLILSAFCLLFHFGNASNHQISSSSS